jgi:hypothetical protein
VELVPSVIGLISDDPHVDVDIALRSATTALPVASGERQRVLAVGVLAAERVRAGLDGRPADTLEEPSRRALGEVPDAARWARGFTRETRITLKGFRRYAAPHIVGHAVFGVAEACIPDPDTMLYDLLVGAIGDCAAYVRRGPDPNPVTPVEATQGPTGIGW